MKKTIFAAALAGAAMLVACGGDKSGVTMGSLSEFDSLSYALGANIGLGMKYQLRDVPFDYKALDKALQESALGKSSLSHDDAIKQLQTYFMEKRPERMQAIAKERAKADSIRLAGGDSTKVEYPDADPSMFESEEERRFISYAFGIDLGNNMLGADLPIQLVWFGQGLKDITGNGEEARMTEQEAVKFLRNWYSVVRPAENKKANEEWIASIEKKSGVQKTESGLLYKIEKKGDETLMPTDSRDRVKVYYTGTNYKGQVFDSSYFENKPEEMKEYLKQIDPEG